ncbi:MAG: MFS transporter [Saprospiraceae bacterium]
MMTPNNKPRSPLFIIFLTIFIDLLGIGIIIPVIPALFFEAGSDFFSPDFPQAQRSILYGFLIATYPILQFFGAPILGSLSDRYGRKPMLLLSLVGTMIGYLLFALAILNKDIWLLFISRGIPGFMGGNIAIILSSISDVSDVQSRAKNFGLVGMAFGLGFILGPTIGGVLADDKVVPWFNAATPFWFTAIITFLNIIIVQFTFKETIKQRQISHITFFSGFRNITTAFQSPNLRAIFIVILLLSLGFSFFTQFFSVYLIQIFSFTESNIGLLFGWIGIWLALTQGLIVRVLSRYISSTSVIMYSILFLSISLGLILLPDQGYWLYFINPLVAISQGITSPNMNAVIAEQASPDQQGQVLGINQSMQSLGQAVPPLIAGYLNALDSRFPLIAASLLVFVGWLVYMLAFKKQPIKRR